jgi:SAM-dependent methyltransferase
MYELNKLFKNAPPLEELLLVEQSATFCQWARRLLVSGSESEWWAPRGDSDQEWWVPFPRYPERAHFARVDVKSLRDRLPILSNLRICCGLGEETPRPDEYFDVVVCLNVVDRHPNPTRFVREIARLVKVGGLLVLGSPFDFSAEFTPQKSEWVHDLESLIPGGWPRTGKSELAYVHRIHRLRFPSYFCQLLGARRPQITKADDGI